ncbi:MAG: response regulator [Candidatus Omnitrophica bacterium]|nr:response regulator [Candidatus Omnitrophota bacterium]MDD5575010.1 response regulator [Candidatus Omnitrophota bacterium]
MEKRRVMVVDDEEHFLKLLKLNLEGTGRFAVLTLSSAKDLVDQLHYFKPEVILLDLLMPGVGGLEVCEMLNRDPLGQGIPIIILSALSKDGDKIAAYKKGVVDYLVKPIEKNDLIGKIEKALSNKYSPEE